MARDLHCSFCDRSEHEVPSLVAGPSVYICGDCVAIAQRAIDGSPPPVARAIREKRARSIDWIGRVRGWLGLRRRTAAAI